MSARRCNSGKRCVDGENVHDEETGEKVDRLGVTLDDHHQGVVCKGCGLATTTALRSLPYDYADLSKLLVPSGERKFRDPELPASSGKPESKLPLRIDVLSLQELIDYEACVWAEAVADQDGVEWDSFAAEHSRPQDRIQRACDLLGYRLPTLLALGPTEHRARSLTERRTDGHDPDLTTRSGDDYWVTREGWQAALLLRSLHQKAERICGRDEGTRLPTPCPYCNRRGLVRDHRANQVACRECHTRMGDGAFEDFMDAAMKSYGIPVIDRSGAPEPCRRCYRYGSRWTDRHGREYCQLCGVATSSIAS